MAAVSASQPPPNETERLLPRDPVRLQRQGWIEAVHQFGSLVLGNSIGKRSPRTDDVVISLRDTATAPTGSQRSRGASGEGEER